MQNSEFEILYKRLNTAQKKAVDTIEGPVMVIAGPGTGKTSILTLRIANILRKTDISPENILALTFTESGAYAMRKKLVAIVGTAGYKVNINTFHGFCNEIIKQYPERFPRIIGSTSITDIDQISIMEKIINSNDFELLKPYGDVFFYIKPALNEIKNLKREGIGVEEFYSLINKQEKEFEDIPEKIHQKGAHKGKMKGEFIKLKEQINKNKELYRLYDEYEKALIKEKYYDFEDMIVEVVKALKKDEDLLLILQETYQYILADEHQDANNSQNSILELLSNFHNNPNIFIVGDEKQAIFRFQGASLENFLYFKKIYKDAILIHLEENYRSTQNILDASHSLISNNILPKGHETISLKAKSQNSKEPIHIFECENIGSEIAFLIKDIKEKIKSGINLEEIAVLYRNNKDAFPLVHALEKEGIPFRIESDNDVLKDENIRKLILIFESINDLSKEENLSKVLFIDFFKINPIEIFKSFDEIRSKRAKLIDIVSKNFPDLAQKLSSWSQIAYNKTFLELFEIIVRESGYLEYTLSNTDSLERMATLDVFWGEIRKMIGSKREFFLKDFIEHLERVREHGILTKTGKASKEIGSKNGLRLMTAHRSKGLEFDIVYIIGAYDGHWGNKSKRKYFNTIPTVDGSIDDERRLFYVAITRARKMVCITYSKQDDEGRDQLPAQFINEISDQYKKINIINDISDIKSNFKESIAHEHHEINNKKYLQQLFLDQGLSVTALNNYLKCPWEYFFVNLIRLPKAQNKHQMYGTAIHETLQIFFNKYKEDEDMTKEELINLFEFNLRKTLLSANDLKDSLIKGKEALSGYFEAYKGHWKRTLLTEYSIRGVHLKIDDFDLLLNGKLDKIEFINERDVNVVDYKTGKRKSSNKENYQRQLVFYKLLLELDEKKKYSMQSGELDFIEPDDKGKYKKDSFEIKENEVQDLIKLLKEVGKDIYNLNFWDKNCDDNTCEYCILSKSLIEKSK